MIVTKLIGGLGNQMFQYTVAKQLAILNNTEFYLDKHLLEGYEKNSYQYRGYNLSHFNIDEKFMVKQKCRIIKENTNVSKFVPTLLDEKGDIYLEGYWQSHKYFDGIKDLILKDFTLKEPFKKENEQIKNKMMITNSISLHVRRDEYPKLPKHFVCGKEYYLKAIDFINKTVPNPHYFIFSDDMDWVRKNIPIKDCTLVEGNIPTPWEDMVLMKYCQHNIILNSTFSWWGAWLNQNTKKIVVAPNRWFNGFEHEIENFKMNGWKIIE